MKSFNKSFIIFCVAIVSTVFFHSYNWFMLSEVDSVLLREGISVATQDDPSYLAPVENFVRGNEWKSNAIGKVAYVGRSPGYGGVYLIFRIFASERIALICLLTLQFVLFGIAASLVPKIMSLLGVHARLGFITGLVVALLPTFSGFLSYTLTEGIIPSLIIAFIFLLLKEIKSKPRFPWSALVLGCIILIRPPMLVWLFVYPILILGKSGFKTKMWNALGFVIAVLPIGCWAIYISEITDCTLDLHPIYQSDSNDLYRPVHSEIWDFHKSWGDTGYDFHRDIDALWKAALNGTNPELATSTISTHVESGTNHQFQKLELEKVYRQYFEVLQNQANYFHSGLPLHGETDSELILKEEFRELNRQYIANHFLRSQVFVPFEVYIRMAAHSNLSLYVFQKTWRGNSLMEFLRWISFLLHLSLFILFPFTVFTSFGNRKILMLVVPVMIYLVYLCFVQRGVEERYTLPILVPLLVIIVSEVARVYTIVRTKSPAIKIQKK